MRTISLAIRIIRQIVHDKRTLALIVIAPIFVLSLLSFVFNGENYHPKIAIINGPISFIDKLETNNAVVARYSESDAEQALNDQKVDAIINFKNGAPKIKLDGSNTAKSQAVLMLVKNVSLPATGVEPDVTYSYGYRNMSSFNNFGPILIGFFVFFFVFLIAGISFLRERSFGTLERLLATPIRRHEIVFGYCIGFGVLTIFQSALIAWFAINVLNIMLIGSFWLVLVITVSTALVALTLGTAMSTFADNELQMMQFIPIVIVPQIFFSGLFDLSTMPAWLQAVAKFTPLYYSADGLTQVMLRGKGWDYIYYDVLVLLAFCVAFMVFNIFALKKYRRI